MPMKTAVQVAADVAVLLIVVSSSGTGAPPCSGAADWLAGGEPPEVVTAIVPAEEEVEFAAELEMPMNTTEQVEADVEVLLADVSSSGTGAPPCGGPTDWSAGGELPGDVTVWGG
ncbi:hypothetical protein QYE76_039557 [Lolium multiflorum]|uniref:Secreted protein n=1 Tax=Lolium multiflorum TaxID=4521 RepID=A0AAD8WSA1_LOLMU|nr:hypothetical protein QYE76_039557 [Lolium multiflorum]